MDPLSVASSAIQLATAIGSITRRFSNSSIDLEHEKTIVLDFLGNTEELLGKMEAATLPDYPVRQKLACLLQQTRVTCQKINETRREAVKPTGLSRETLLERLRASTRVDEPGPRNPTNEPFTSIKRLVYIPEINWTPMSSPTQHSSVETLSPDQPLSEKDQTRQTHPTAADGHAEHESELRALFLHLEDLGQQLLDLLGEDADKPTGMQSNLEAPEQVENMDPRICLSDREREQEKPAGDKKGLHNQEKMLDDEKALFDEMDVRHSSNVMKLEDLEGANRPTNTSQSPPPSKNPQERPGLHFNGLNSCKNDKKPKHNLAAAAMIAAVIGATEMSVWDMLRRHDGAVPLIPFIRTTETSTWDHLLGRQYGAKSSSLHTLATNSLPSFLCHPTVLISGTVMNITALTVYYHLRCGRGRSGFRDLALVVCLSLAVGVGYFWSLDATSVLVLVAPWAGIIALFGAA